MRHVQQIGLLVLGAALALVGAPAQAQLIRLPEAEQAYNRGQQLLEEGKYKEALTALNEAIRIDNTYTEALAAAGEALLELQDYQGAAVAFTRALDLDANSVVAYNGRGEANMELGFADMAVLDFQNAIERDRTNAEALSNLGHLYANNLRDPSSALRYLDDAIELNPTDARSCRDRGWAHTQLRDFDKGIEDMKKAVEADPTDYENYSRLATIHLFKDDFGPAVDALTKALETYKPKKRGEPEQYITGYIMRADARLRLGEEIKDPAQRAANFEAVIADANTVLAQYEDRYPESGYAFYRKGRAERMLERYSDAVDSLTRAIQLVPAGQVEAYVSDAYMYRGICWFYIGSLDLARGDFEQAASTGNGYQDPRMYLWVGITYHRQGDFRRAIEAYSESIAKSPSFALAHVNRGRAYMDLEEYTRAIENFNNAIRAEPNVGEHYYNVGYAYNQLRDWQKAVDFLNLAVRKDDPQPKMFRQLAVALRGLGRDDLAAEYERRAQEANPPASGG